MAAETRVCLAALEFFKGNAISQDESVGRASGKIRCIETGKFEIGAYWWKNQNQTLFSQGDVHGFSKGLVKHEEKRSAFRGPLE